MSTPVTSSGYGASRAGLRFRVFGFPVVIDLSFVIVLTFLGWANVTRGLAYVVVWVAVAIVAVLLHELGHAFAARAAGAAPSIELSGFGGVTTFRLSDRPSRLRNLGISAAGPAVGLAVGAALLLMAHSIDIAPGSVTAFVANAALFVTIGWSLLNLLPILPMDGGHIMAELLPGTPGRRDLLAAVVSVGVAAVAGALALLAGWWFAALLAAWFAFMNLSGLQPRKAVPAAMPITAEQSQQRTKDSHATLWLIDQGQVDEARHLAETAQAGVDPAVFGVLMAHLGDVSAGKLLVERALEQAPDDPLRQDCLLRISRLRPVDGGR